MIAKIIEEYSRIKVNQVTSTGVNRFNIGSYNTLPCRDSIYVRNFVKKNKMTTRADNAKTNCLRKDLEFAKVCLYLLIFDVIMFKIFYLLFLVKLKLKNYLIILKKNTKRETWCYILYEE